MNGLSWILYLADVSESLGWSFGLVLILSGTVGAVGVIALFAGASMVDSASTDKERADAKEVRAFGAGLFLRIAIPVFIGTFIIAALIPSSKTLMLIAASQTGETLLASAPVQEMGGEAGALATDSLRLLHKYVQEQLGETAAEPPK